MSVLKGGRLMTQEQARVETQYLLVRSVYLGLFESDQITVPELLLALETAAKQYGSVIGELEVNSNAVENYHKNRLSVESSAGSGDNG